MKIVGYWAIVLGATLPNLALAGRKLPTGKQACETQAQANFKKKAVEVEMASIIGNFSEIEVTSEREGLRARFENEKADCLHVANSDHSYAESNTDSL